MMGERPGVAEGTTLRPTSIAGDAVDLYPTDMQFDSAQVLQKWDEVDKSGMRVGSQTARLMSVEHGLVGSTPILPTILNGPGNGFRASPAKKLSCRV